MLPSFSSVKKRKRHDEFYDPDYERMHSSPLKKLYVDGKINQENNVATNLIGNIKSISPRITLLLQNEVLMKRKQLTELDKKLDCARASIDRLRFGVVDKYYDKNDLIISETESSTVRGKASLFEVEVSEPQIKMHPAVKYLIRKRPKETEKFGKLIPELPAAHNANNTISACSELQKRRERRLQQVIREHGLEIDNSKTETPHFALTSAAILPTKRSRTNTTVCKSGSHSTITQSIVNEGTFERAMKPLNISRLNNKTKHMIVIGNTSRYIGQDHDNGEGQIPLGANNFTHKWLVYVQSKDSNLIQSFIKKVRFNLDSSYRPNDVVDIQEPPFQITRRGWGEFPIRIQLYFHEHLKQKPIQIIHNLVLDRTLSGMHTLGAETLMEIWLRTNAGIEQCLFYNNRNLKVIGDINNKEETKCKSPSNDTTTATKGKKDLDDKLSNQIKSNIEPKEPILSKYRNDSDSVTPKECPSVITQNYKGMLPEQKEKSIENNSVSSLKFLKPVFEKRALAKPMSLKDEEIEDTINKSKSVLITSYEAKKFTTAINSYSKKSNTNNIIALRRVVNLVPLKGANLTTPDVKYSSARLNVEKMATKDIFQKKLVQFKNTRSEIKPTQVLVGIANNLPVTEVGSLNRKCRCGTEISCSINNHENDTTTKVDCILKGKFTGKKCGKRPLRSINRKNAIDEILFQEIHVYKANKRREIQQHGDPDPPILPTDNVLAKAKSEHKTSQYLHKDPIKALCILKRSAKGVNVIQQIGCDPFFIYFFSNYQLKLWNLYSDLVPLIIDSTSGIATKVVHADNQQSHSLFLHIGVINCKIGQHAVCAGITERQDTVSIQTMLLRLIQAGGNIPKQVICDSSRALLTASISAFTRYRTVEEYCDAYFDNPSSMEGETLISIDVAHYIKIWARFLSNKGKRIKVFYMACVGRLITCKTLNDAEDIIKNLLIISISETDGCLRNGLRTKCEISKGKLKALITSDSECDKLNDAIEMHEEESDSECESDIERKNVHNNEANEMKNKFLKASSNKWQLWAERIRHEVEIINEEGDHENAHADPKIAEKLIKECKHIPMWSNIFQNKFDNCKPSSSASVESEFRKIKHGVLQKKGKTTRVDETVQKLIEYYDGRLRMISYEESAGKDNETISPTHESMDVSDSMELTVNITTSPEAMDTNDSFGFRDDQNKSPATIVSKIQPRSPLKIIQLNSSKCICGSSTTTVMLCIICERKIHSSDNCSLLYEDANGDRRICLDCVKSTSFTYKLSLNEIENYGGLALKEVKKQEKQKVKKSLYIDNPRKIADALAFKSNAQNIPLFKNGSSMKMEFVKINKSLYFFKYTCGLDSLLQIMLAAATDYLAIQNLISQCKNDFFTLLNDVIAKGISSKSYIRRGKILLEHSSQNKENKGSDPTVINCATSVNTLQEILFKECPSFKKTFKCPRNCTKADEQYSSYIAQINELFTNKIFSTIRQQMCKPKNCQCGAAMEVDINYGTKVTVQSSVPKMSVKYITSSSVNLSQNDSSKDENKNKIWTQSLASYTKRNISELTSNTIDSPKQIVFQKEGKLFIIDPLKIKLKQERKKQISLLKPQTYSKHQHQQQSHYKSDKSKALQCMMSDHDYTPSVANSTLNKSTTSARNNSGSIKSFDDELQPKVSEANFGVEQPLVERGTDSELLQQLQIQFEQEFVARNVGVRYVVDYVLHHLPLIAPKSILASSFSFSSQCLMDFDVLPIMKQRACEWLRAKYVKNFLRKNKYLEDLNWTNKEVSWSTREVLVYARYHGFTPKMKLFDVSSTFKPQTRNSTSKTIPIHPSNPEQPNNTKVNNDFEQRHKLSQYLRRRVKLDRNYFRFESLTPYSRITSWLFAAYRKLNIDKRSSEYDSEPIDIVNIIPTNAFRETLNCKTINRQIKQLRCMRISEHLSESSMLVNDFVRALSIKLEPEIVEMDETFPLVHTVIAQCLNLFVEKLIRHTVALKTNTSVVDSLHITKQDIGNILVRYTEFDFLTTKYFGKYEYDLKKCVVEM